MATLREIRKLLRSVENIKKITQAMEMVAASRLRKAQAKAEMSRPYAHELKKILELMLEPSELRDHPLIHPRPVKKRGLIVIAGDRGLCGSYNQAVFLKAEGWLKEQEESELILVGTKPVNYFSGKRWPISHQLINWGGKISYGQIQELAYTLMAEYKEKKVDELWLIYTHFVSPMVRKVLMERLLPLEMPVSQEKRGLTYLFEPNPHEILEELLPRYCVTKVQTALSEAYASELAARVFSMRTATKNAEEVIKKWTLVHNRVRQSNITKELIEITSGAEGIK